MQLSHSGLGLETTSLRTQGHITDTFTSYELLVDLTHMKMQLKISHMWLPVLTLLSAKWDRKERLGNQQNLDCTDQGVNVFWKVN
jgi:hypothetical protein